MKKLLSLLLILLFLLPLSLDAQKRGGHYSGGKGSSHKGGTYKNKKTNDHYTKRK